MPLIVLSSEVLDHFIGSFVYLTFIAMSVDAISRTAWKSYIGGSKIPVSAYSLGLSIPVALWALGVIFFQRPDISGVFPLLLFAFLLKKKLAENQFDLVYARLSILPALIIILVFTGGVLFGPYGVMPSDASVQSSLEVLSFLFGSINETDAVAMVTVATPLLVFFAKKPRRQFITILFISAFFILSSKSGALAVLAIYLFCYAKPKWIKPAFGGFLIAVSVTPFIFLFSDLSFMAGNTTLSFLLNGRGDIWYQCSQIMKNNMFHAIFFGAGDFLVNVDSVMGRSHLAGKYGHHSGFIRLFMLKGIIIYLFCVMGLWIFAKGLSNDFKNVYCSSFIFAFSTLNLTDLSFFYSLVTVVYLLYPAIILHSVTEKKNVPYRLTY